MCVWNYGITTGHFDTIPTLKNIAGAYAVPDRCVRFAPDGFAGEVMAQVQICQSMQASYVSPRCNRTINSDQINMLKPDLCKVVFPVPDPVV